MAWKARYSCNVRLTDGTTTSLKMGDVAPSNTVHDGSFRLKFFWSEKEDVVEISSKSEKIISENNEAESISKETDELNIQMRTNGRKLSQRKNIPIHE